MLRFSRVLIARVKCGQMLFFLQTNRGGFDSTASPYLDHPSITEQLLFLYIYLCCSVLYCCRYTLQERNSFQSCRDRTDIGSVTGTLFPCFFLLGPSTTARHHQDYHSMMCQTRKSKTRILPTGPAQKNYYVRAKGVFKTFKYIVSSCYKENCPSVPPSTS